jgi:hypothetical protein
LSAGAIHKVDFLWFFFTFFFDSKLAVSVCEVLSIYVQTFFCSVVENLPLLVTWMLLCGKDPFFQKCFDFRSFLQSEFAAEEGRILQRNNYKSRRCAVRTHSFRRALIFAASCKVNLQRRRAEFYEEKMLFCSPLRFNTCKVRQTTNPLYIP